MDSYLSNKHDNFVNDPEKLYRLGRREAQAKKLEFADPKAEVERSSESPKESPSQSPRENRLPPMGEQPQLERRIGELCTPDILNLPILNLAEIGRLFEIKTSTIRMVQRSPFTGKEDPNVHLQVFIQLCQTFNMDRDYILRRIYQRHSSASMSTLGRFHVTSFRRRILFKSSIKDLSWHQGQSSMHRREDPSLSLRRLKLSLYSRRSRTMTRGLHPDTYFRFNP
jgi:hypothetical protein